MDQAIDRIFRRSIYLNYVLINTFIHIYVMYFLPNNLSSRFNYIYYFNISVFIVASLFNQVLFINQTILLILFQVYGIFQKSLEAIFNFNNRYIILEIDFHFTMFYLINLCIVINFMLCYLVNNINNLKEFNIIFDNIPGKSVYSEKMCSICLEKNSNWLLDCNHYFHYKCLKNWYKINKTCPYCRAKLTPNK